ncbi:MAG: exodeoxyribonuclease VII large subunit [Candidatus Neomarinimicrobiota bacterium]
MSDPEASLSVSDLTRLIKDTLEGQFPSVWVSGEISNFIHHRSGHMYFTLKDDRSEIKAVMFKGNNLYLRFRPDSGLQVLVQGRISVFETRGYYQIIINRMEPAGIGTLYLAYEALKKRLAAEGLFDPERKRPLPPYPKTIGVITSPTGAAIRDIIQVLQRRAPYLRIILRPALVQGDDAAADIVAALGEFADYGQVDVLIVGRGGGSLEDLWPFNEEALARALAACPLPVISAVGHETDITIADLVADQRAATPSAAAELAAPAGREIAAELGHYSEVIGKNMQRIVENRFQAVDQLTARYGFRQPQQLLNYSRQRLAPVQRRLWQAPAGYLKLLNNRLDGLQHRLAALNPDNVLQRGYALARRRYDGKVLRAAGDLQIGEAFDLQLARGRIEAEKTGDADD